MLSSGAAVQTIHRSPFFKILFVTKIIAKKSKQKFQKKLNEKNIGRRKQNFENRALLDFSYWFFES
jgi:hypothetical protein